MKIKIISSVVALAFGSVVGVAQGATATTQTTVERSTTIEAPAVANPVSPRVEQTTTTKTKEGVLGRKKSETTSSSVTYDAAPAPAPATTSSEYKSRTTVETERRN